MVFSAPSFLFLFLPLALSLGLVFRRVAFPPAILAISLVFYYWTAGAYALILGCFVLLDLLLLVYYKYAGFLAVNVDALAGTHIAALLGAIILPVGISFFTFQGISYLVDVYRGDVVAEPSLIVFGAYKAFFPQLIAGPIVRYRDVANDFHNPRIAVDLIAAGVARFAHGLLKKVLIADNVAGIVDATFGLAPNELSCGAAWLGALAFAIQIYFDFSGYSDMAIGLGQMLGIRIPENFNRPYSSRSITEFWRRWHISLSSWFRDYVYIPMGGSRQATFSTYRNLLAVFLLVGLWHGAAWTFIAWGAYNGFFLILERIVLRNRADAVNGKDSESAASILVRLLYCAPVVLVGWVIFRAPDLHTAAAMIQAMFSPGGDRAFAMTDGVIAAMAPPLHMFALIGGTLVFLLPRGDSLGRLLGRPSLPLWGEAASLAYAAAACVIATCLILPGGFSPFLYFRF